MSSRPAGSRRCRYGADRLLVAGVVWAPWLGRKVAFKILGNTDEASSVIAETPFETRPLYHGNPWFVPWIVRWYGLKDRFMYGRRF